MGPDDSRVEERTDVIDVDLQLLEDAFPDTSRRPPGKAVVDGLPRTDALREVAPGNACLRPPEHCIDELAVTALAAWPRRAPKEWLNLLPLRFGELVAMHTQR